MPHQHTHLLGFPHLSHIGEYASTPRVRLNLAGHTRVVTSSNGRRPFCGAEPTSLDHFFHPVSKLLL